MCLAKMKNAFYFCACEYDVYDSSFACRKYWQSLSMYKSCLMLWSVAHVEMDLSSNSGKAVESPPQMAINSQVNLI